MLWNLWLSFFAFFVPQELDVSPETYPHGPQTPFARAIALEALYGKHKNGDIWITEASPMDAAIRDLRWPKRRGFAEVPYTIDASLVTLTPLILEAMEQYHEWTCIRFIPRTDQTDFVNLFNGTGCYSNVGRVGDGHQDVSLGRGCGYIGTVVHELGHAVGLHHEHQRSDRDNFITVYPQNVAQGMIHNFVLTSELDELEFDRTRYDYDSVMHYGSHAFSKLPGKLVTMEARNGQKLLEPFDKAGFTLADIDLLNTMYECQQ